MRRRLGVLVAAVAVSVGCAGPSPAGPNVTGSTPAGPPPLTSGLELAGMDRNVRPQDDLFAFTNGSWLRDTSIPPDRSELGAFSTLAVRAEEDQRTLVEQMADDTRAPVGSNARKVGDLYASYLDTARLDQLRATPLDNDFAAIDRLTTPADLVRHLGEIQRVGASSPIGLGVGPDDRNAEANITFAGQEGLTLPARDYYLSVDAKYVEIRDRFRAYVAKMFTLSGRPDPGGAAARVLDVETKLARAQWTTVRNRDPLATYNKFAVADATARTPGLDWGTYLGAAGMLVSEVMIAQPGYFTALGGLLRTVSMDDWKQYLRWQLISDAAPYLSGDFVDTRFEFVGKVLGGREQNRERWRRGIAAVSTAMGEALGELYVRRYFVPEAKARMDRLVATVVDAFGRSIDTLDWMEPATKAEARDKLAKMAVKIGYPERWKDYSRLEIRRDDLVGNMRRASELVHQRALDKLATPVDRDEWGITPQTVNATYNPSLNAITFPAAILAPPFFDVAADDAVNYGAIGAVIGHEVSHAFDDQGRRYDGKGNLRDWWTPRDTERFTAKTRALVRRYEGFAPLPGAQLNGQLTLGENIADLSGLAMSLRAYRASRGGLPAPVLDGFTGEQRFFLGYARVWRTKERDEAMRQSLLTDPHSPGEFRTNGVVSNLDGFHQAFDVKPGDKLFRSEPERIRIW